MYNTATTQMFATGVNSSPELNDFTALLPPLIDPASFYHHAPSSPYRPMRPMPPPPPGPIPMLESRISEMNRRLHVFSSSGVSSL
jgi:hypothetical protein